MFMKKRIDDIKNIINHRKTISEIWLENDTKVSKKRMRLHDLDKLILTIFFGYDFAKKIHIKNSSHHNINSKEDLYEAYLNWASDKYYSVTGMNAIQFAKNNHPNHYNDAIRIFKELNYC